MEPVSNHLSYILCATCANKVNPWSEIREARAEFPSMVLVRITKVPEVANPDALEIMVEVLTHDVLVFRVVPTIAENRWLYLVEDQNYNGKYGWLEGKPFPDVSPEVLQATGDGVAAIMRWVEPTIGRIELDLRIVGFDGDLELWNITRKLVGPDRQPFLIGREN